MKRGGVKPARCENDCGAVIYVTAAQVEAGHRAVCGCGGRFIPADIELAGEILEPEELATFFGLDRQLNGAARQAKSGNISRTVRDHWTIVLERQEKAMRADNAARRRASLKQYRGKNEIPF